MKDTIEAHFSKWLKSQGHKPESIRVCQLIVHPLSMLVSQIYNV